MRKIYNLLVVIALVVSFSSCEKDNYDAPEAGVYGQIVDHNGKIFQTAMGQGSMKIQITELSYAGGDESVVVTNQNLNMRQDGSYSNSKLFAGTIVCFHWKELFILMMQREKRWNLEMVR